MLLNRTEIAPIFAAGIIIDSFSTQSSDRSHLFSSILKKIISLKQLRVYLDCNKSKIGKCNSNNFIKLMDSPFQRDNQFSFLPNQFIIEPFSCECNFIFDQRDKSKRRNTSAEIYNYIKIKLKINENNNIMSISIIMNLYIFTI